MKVRSIDAIMDERIARIEKADDYDVDRSNDRKEIGLVITLCEKTQIRNYRIGELTGR